MGSRGSSSRDPSGGPPLSPFGRRLYGLLAEAGAEGLDVHHLGIQGAVGELDGMDRLGLAVRLEGGLFLSVAAYRSLVARILEGLAPEDSFPIAQAKERSGLSRKLLIPLLNRMAGDGFVRRADSDRVVLKLPEPDDPGAAG